MDAQGPTLRRTMSRNRRPSDTEIRRVQTSVERKSWSVNCPRNFGEEDEVSFALGMGKLVMKNCRMSTLSRSGKRERKSDRCRGALQVGKYREMVFSVGKNWWK